MAINYILQVYQNEKYENFDPTEHKVEAKKVVFFQMNENAKMKNILTTNQLNRIAYKGSRAAIGYATIGEQTENYNYKLAEIPASNKNIQVRETPFLEFDSKEKIDSVIVVSNENNIISIIK